MSGTKKIKKVTCIIFANKHRRSELEKEMATWSRTPAWKIPWREEHGRLQSIFLSFSFFLSLPLSFFHTFSYFFFSYFVSFILLFPVSQASLWFFKQRTDFIAPEAGKVFFPSHLHIIFIKYGIKLVTQNIVNFVQTAQTWPIINSKK